MANKEKIVFMGSPDFSLSALGALHENYSVVGVVTQPDRAGGRGRRRLARAVRQGTHDAGEPGREPGPGGTQLQRGA